MIQEDRTVHCELCKHTSYTWNKNCFISRGNQTVYMLQQGQKINCNFQLCTYSGYQVAMATKFCTMAPNLWRSSVRHYLGFHCGASEICILLVSYTALVILYQCFEVTSQSHHKEKKNTYRVVVQKPEGKI